MVHLANEIARFWAAYPHDEAVAQVAGHIRSFWEPRFRRQLVEYGQTGGAGLHDEPGAVQVQATVTIEAELNN